MLIQQVATIKSTSPGPLLFDVTSDQELSRHCLTTDKEAKKLIRKTIVDWQLYNTLLRSRIDIFNQYCTQQG